MILGQVDEKRSAVRLRWMNGARSLKQLGSLGGVDDTGLFSIVTPGQMKDYADQLQVSIDGLNQDAVNSLTLNTVTANQFAQWSATWTEFYNSLSGPTGWLKRAWAGTADRLVSYRKQADEWRATLSSKGVSVTAPGLPPPPAPSGLPGILTTVAIGGGVIMGGFVLLKVLDVLPKASQARR